MGYNRKDFYFKKAKEENFAARSVFKLEEMDAKYKILRRGDQVLDLGAAPGSWSQYASERIGPEGRVLAIDLQKIKLTLPNVLFVEADLRDLHLETLVPEQGFNRPFDVVLSDMAPRTTGIRFTDQARSLELCELALQTSLRFLRKGGHFVCKLFHSGEFEAFRGQLRNHFEKTDAMRPQSTRKESKEIFFIARTKK